MPQRDPNELSSRGRSRRRGTEADENADFWGRSNRTRREDRQTGRRRGRGEGREKRSARQAQEPVEQVPPPARGPQQARPQQQQREIDLTNQRQGRGPVTPPPGTGGAAETASARRLARLTPWSTPQVPDAAAPAPAPAPAPARRPARRPDTGVARRAETGAVPRQNTGVMRPATGPVPRQPPPNPGRRPAPYRDSGHGQGGYSDQGYAYGRYREEDYGDARGATYGDVRTLPEDMVFGTYGDDVYNQDDTYGEDDPEGDIGKDLSRGRRRAWFILMFLTLIVLVVAVGLGWWAQREIDPSGPPGDAVTVELESGQSTAQIAQVLHDQGVIGDPRVFTIYARLRNKGDIQAGLYELQTNMPMGDVLDVLAEGPALDEDEALVPEGLTVEETLQRLAGSDGIEGFDENELRAAIEGGEVRSRHFGDLDTEGVRILEGMLFPSTYKVGENEAEAELLKKMVSEFDDLYESLDVETRAADLGLADGYEVLIVASMIEREARVDGDRVRIARVIYNRLEQGHPLQIDATSCYDKEGACHPLSNEDLEGPYSTRNEVGLPPTPIAAPGKASLEAALNPEPGDWFYYVLDVEANDGSHVITADEAEWEAARQKCVQEGLCG